MQTDQIHISTQTNRVSRVHVPIFIMTDQIESSQVEDSRANENKTLRCLFQCDWHLGLTNIMLCLSAPTLDKFCRDFLKGQTLVSPVQAALIRWNFHDTFVWQFCKNFDFWITLIWRFPPRQLYLTTLSTTSKLTKTQQESSCHYKRRKIFLEVAYIVFVSHCPIS